MKRILIIAITIFSTNTLFAQSDIPRWMQQSGWVDYSEVCKTQHKFNGTSGDCSIGNYVTDSKSPFGAIYWAGEVIQLYYDENITGFSKFKIEVKYQSSSANYYCGQILKRNPEEVKEFTKTSLNLKKCN